MGELPNKHVVDHPDAYLNVLLDYTGGFYGAAREAGLPAKTCADAMQHVESAARGLHRKANEAASRIAELEAKLATAVGALEPFAKAFWTLSHRWQDHEDHWQSALHRKLNVGELRAAATAYRDASIQERT